MKPSETLSGARIAEERKIGIAILELLCYHGFMNAARQNTLSATENWADYRDCLEVVTSYIHSHIDGELHLEHLAGLTGFSPFHFHRIFAALMGETLAEYVRRARLGAAVQRLLHSNQPVTEIALAVGYETPAAFTKAFRQRFGIAPKVLRTLDRAQAYALLMKPPPANTLKRRKIQPEIRTLPDQWILYARRTGMIDQSLNQAANEAFTTLMRYVQDHDLKDTWTMCVGITPDDHTVVPHEQCRFDAGVVLKPGVQLQPGEAVEVQVLAGGRWAVFQHKGPYESLWQTWNIVDRDWLPRSGERLRDAPPMEIYLDDASKTPPEALRTEILIPIV
jgi:AraC family transcriptional regulator